ncbi:DUF6350 family protein [Actinomyces faecalis]|nr:DUF6350 family protein [Actinomyces faecalis]
MATSSMDAAAALSVGTALRTGTALWSLGLGGGYGSPSDPAGAIELPLLGLTLLQLLLARSAVRRAHLRTAASGGLLILTTTALAVFLVLVTSPAGSRTWPAILGTAVVSTLVVSADLQRRGRGSRRLADWWHERPAWVSPALVLARDTAVVLLAASVLVLLAAVVDGSARVSRLHDALAGGGVIASAGLVLLQLGWVPTVLVWALSWLAGPGFVVGTGSTFTPDHVVAGAVPTLPVLGLLPTASLGGEGSRTGLYLPMVLTAAALVVVWVCRRRLRALPLAQAVIAAVAASLLVALGTGACCLAASGSIGPGRLAEVGPNTVMTVVLLLVEVGVGLVAAAVLVHPRTRVATEHGVRQTVAVAGSAAASTREKVEAGARAAQERRERVRAERESARARGSDDAEAEPIGADTAVPAQRVAEDAGAEAGPVVAGPERREPPRPQPRGEWSPAADETAATAGLTQVRKEGNDAD